MNEDRTVVRDAGAQNAHVALFSGTISPLQQAAARWYEN